MAIEQGDYSNVAQSGFFQQQNCIMEESKKGKVSTMGSYVVMEYYQSGPRKGQKKDEEDCRYWRLYANGKKKKNGKRNQRTKYFRGTKREMLAELAAFESTVEKEKANKIKFKDYADEWLERRMLTDLSSTTLQSNKYNVQYMKGFLGNYWLDEITPTILDDMYYTLLSRGTSGKPMKQSSIFNLQLQLGMIFKEAVRRGYLDKNPMDDAIRAKKIIGEKKVAANEDVREMLGKLDYRNHHQMGVFLCTVLGLRRGEALGLQFGDIQWSTEDKPGYMHIQHNYVSTKEMRKPKTRESNRILPIEPFVEEALKVRKKQVEQDIEAALKAGIIEEKPDLAKLTICCKSDGTPLSPSGLTGWWDRNREGLGFPQSLHELRHSFISACVNANIPVRTVMSLAGHSTANVTLEVYSHTSMEQKEEALSTLAGLVAPETESGEDESADE